MRRRRLVYLTKPGCGLCDEALPSLLRAARWLWCDVDVVDIAGDADLEAEYFLRIPVVLDERGTVLAEGPIGRRESLVAVIKTYR